MLLPWALYLGGRLGLPDDTATRWLMVGGIVLASLPVIVPPLGSGIVAAVASRTIVSAWMFGGLLVLAALVRGALHADQPSAEAKRQASRAMSEATAVSRTSPAGCPSSVSLTRGLAIFLLLNALVLNGLIWLASPSSHKETVLQHSWDVLRIDGSDNSWGAMAIALDYFRSGEPRADLQRGLLRPQRQVPVSAVVAVRADGDAGGGAAGARAHHRRECVRLAHGQ